MRATSPWFLAIFFWIGTLAALAASSVVGHVGHADSELQMFYVQGFSKTFFYTASFFALCALATSAFASIPAFRKLATNTWRDAVLYAEGVTLFRYALLSFSFSGLVLFLLNAQGVIHGTFLIDDYEMYGIATQKSAWQLVWTPINDHVIPLFWLELKALFALIGTNTPILNFPLFIPAIGAIGAAGMLLRQLRFGVVTFATFIALFATTTVVSHQLYGFYAVAPYFQVLAVFTLSLVCFTHARQQNRFSKTYFAASILLIAVSVFLESGGIWTPLAFALFAVAYRIDEYGGTRIASVVAAAKKEALALMLPIAIVLLYLTYLAAIPYFSDASFYGPDRLPISITTLYELYKVLTAGVLSAFFIPRLGLVMSQPRFESVEVLWHIGMCALFAGATLTAWWTYMRGSVRTRIWGVYFMLLTLGTSLLVAIARPSSHAVSFYRDQNLLFPLFFIALFFTIALHEWVRVSRDEASKAIRSIFVIALCSLVFASQLVFSFYKEQYLGDTTFNRELISSLRKTLVPALNEYSLGPTPFSVPSLGGMYLGSSSYQLPDLSEFSYFLGIHNVTWVPPGKNAATSSTAFAKALQHDERLRIWYLSQGEIAEICIAEPVSTNPRPVPTGEAVILARNAITAQTGTLLFDITARDAPEKIFLSIAFENEFAATGTLAVIRLDQYTKQVQGDMRRYTCTVNLNDIPAYALSKKIKNLSLTTQTPGTYTLSARLLQNGEIPTNGTQ